MSKTFAASDVAAHKKPDDLWVIVDEDVYDLTQFQTEHPGGQKILQRVGGKDASKQFWKYHNEGILKKFKGQLQVGSLDSKKQAAAPPTPPATPPPAPEKEKEIVKPKAESGTVAPMPGKEVHEAAETMDSYGDMIPYADPSWYQGHHSPYFNETHAALRDEVRQWVDSEIEPNVSEWEEAKKVPDTIYKQMGERGYLAGLMGLHKYPTHLTDHRVKSVQPEKWDLFHELLTTDEISRAGSGGLVWNLLGGFGIGCPPLVKFGKKPLVDRILPGILNGDKRICLAITEPDAGSDVANLTCEAKLSEDGKHYIVNGEKKWITNGIWSDYFTTAVRTGGEGMNGVSCLLIEREHGGVSTRRMDCQGVWSSGTTYITFEDVKVPVGNLIGKENQGFKVIMTNFNHERIGIIIQCIRFSRVCYEESVKYAHKRRTFGKKLIDHPVIRLKLAHMARQIEASYNWLESVIYQCQMMSDTEAMLKLGGAIASLKAQSTITFEFCAREASQIFGGLSYSRGGQGAKVERLYRDVRAYAIPGGSEEIMLDLSIRQALRVHKALDFLTRRLSSSQPQPTYTTTFMTTLTPTDIKTLEQTRQRLSQLTNSLASLQQSLLQSDPLPSWSSLTSLTTILAHSLTSLSTHLTTNQPLLSALTVYPLPSFPGRTHEAVLLQLMRKKLEPGVEDWVDEGRAIGGEVLGYGGGDGDAGVEERKGEIEELWQWAGMAANQEARRHEWGGEFTVEEREGVVTGLKEEEEDEEDEEDEEEEEEEEGKGEAMAMEDVLRFLVKGEVGG